MQLFACQDCTAVAGCRILVTRQLNCCKKEAESLGTCGSASAHRLSPGFDCIDHDRVGSVFVDPHSAPLRRSEQTQAGWLHAKLGSCR